MPQQISAKGFLKPAETYPIHAPAGAQLVKLPWREGSAIAAGEPILELASAELQLRWQQAQTRLAQQRQRIQHAAVTPEQRQNLQVFQQEQNRAAAELASVESELARYSPTAPFAGVLRNIHPDLRPGEWVTPRERLAVLVRPGPWRVETYLDEADIARVKVGDRARFFLDGPQGPVLDLRVDDIEMDATRNLQNGQLALQFGGSVMTREKQARAHEWAGTSALGSAPAGQGTLRGRPRRSLCGEPLIWSLFALWSFSSPCLRRCRHRWHCCGAMLVHAEQVSHDGVGGSILC